MKVILAGLAIAAMVLGCDKKQADVIDKKYHGEWTYATRSGDQLLRAECISSGSFSRTISAMLEGKKAITKIVLFPDNTTCDGTDKIVAISTATMKDAGSSDVQQILKISTSSEDVTVSGNLAVAFLNTESACGRSDWKEGSYNQSSAEMTTCTSDNEGSVINTPDTDEDIKVTRIRLKEAHGGLSISRKKESENDAEFDVEPSYFLKN